MQGNKRRKKQPIILIVSGGFAPAGPNTIWKKRYTKDNNETQAYEALMEDTASSIVPMFYREVEYNSECILLILKFLGDHMILKLHYNPGH